MDTRPELAYANQIHRYAYGAWPRPSADFEGRMVILEGATESADQLAFCVLMRDGSWAWTAYGIYPIPSTP